MRQSGVLYSIRPYSFEFLFNITTVGQALVLMATYAWNFSSMGWCPMLVCSWSHHDSTCGYLARMLKKLRTTKGYYWIKQRFSSIAPLFKIGTSLMPRSHIHGLPRWFHYGSNPTDDPGNANFRSPNWMHNASTTTYDYGCNTEIYGLIRIATDDASNR